MGPNEIKVIWEDFKKGDILKNEKLRQKVNLGLYLLRESRKNIESKENLIQLIK